MVIQSRLSKMRTSRKAAGQSLVEFALMLPVLLLLIVGSLDLGRAYFTYISVINAAREGARYGAAHPTDTANIRSRAKNEVDSNFITLASLNVSPTCVASCVHGNTMVVTVSYPFRLYTAEAVGGAIITISAKEEMEIYVE